MIFTSVTYLLFLALYISLYWLLPRQFRLWLILIASTIFYGFWKPVFLAVIFLSATTDYFVAMRIEATEKPIQRRAWLVLSLSVNLGLLFYFKYLFFVVGNAAVILNLLSFKVQM